jgi:hypothetical protein
MDSPTKNVLVPLAALLSLSFFTTPATARECVHGHSGVLQDPYDVAIATWAGHGLEYWDNSGKQTWIHYSVPVNADEKLYSTIRIRYSRSNCGNIEEVRVYDGERIVKTFEYAWDFWTQPGAYRYLYLKLDAPGRFWNSIGVTIDPAGTWDAGCGNSKLTIHSVCAFEP